MKAGNSGIANQGLPKEARAIAKTGVRGSGGMIRRPALEEPVCLQSPGYRP